MKTNFYVYVYYDHRVEPPEPIYVGKGKGNRCYNHLTKATNPILLRKIRHIKEAGLEPRIERVLEDVTCDEAMTRERELIAEYGRIDLGTGTLCNLTDGGEGAAGRKASEKTRRLMSEQRKGKKQTEAQYRANCARRMSAETKAKMSKASKGQRRHTFEQIEAIKRSNATRTISDATRTLWSKQRRGKKQTQEHIENMRAALKARWARETPEERSARYAKFCGKKKSEETKQKLRDAWVRRRERSASDVTESVE